jgi:hypothetical protein
MVWMVNNKSETTGKKVALAWFKMQSQYLRGWTEEKYEKPQNNRSSSRDLKAGLQKYEAAAPTTRPR